MSLTHVAMLLVSVGLRMHYICVMVELSTGAQTT